MMKRPLNTYKIGDIVLVSFPFTDSDQTKNRPALVVSDDQSFNQVAQHTILAMITSSLHASWPLDMVIADLASCGLIKPSLIRFKIFTLDNRFIGRKIGHLADRDARNVKKHVEQVFTLKS